MLLSQGSFYSAAIQLSSIYTVIPYISTQLSAPAAIVGLIVPLYTAGVLYGTIIAPRALSSHPSIVWLMVGVAASQAVLIALIAANVAFVERGFAIYPVLALVVPLGLVSGYSVVSFPLVISALLSPRRRSDLLLRQTGLGAVLMIGVAALSAAALSRVASDLGDAKLLFLGAGAMAVAAVFCLGLRPDGAQIATVPARPRDVLREATEYMRSQAWFQRYMLTQLIFRSVTLGPLFYSIHGVRAKSGSGGKLDSILIFIGVGLLGGIWFWAFVRDHFDTRAVYMLSAAISAAAAVLCIANVIVETIPSLWAFGIIMLLASVANQAVYPASLTWIFSAAPEDVRVTLISFSQLTMNVAVIVAAFALGTIAGVAPLWPLLAMLCLSGLAFWAAARMDHVSVGHD